MLGYLIFLFTAVPVLELILLIEVGQYIGAILTVSIVIFTGVTGAYMAKMQGIMTLKKIQDDINRGLMPADVLVDGLIILVSGVLLITPGFMTDIAGFLGLIPFTRNIFKRWLKRKIERMISNGRVITVTNFRSW